ncbi:Fur family zinc uptake transcriptional regulator [Sinorhizobium fredii]|jgi:Fur family transcriptional regulator, zinc uptake regulator|uniref:Ferric uptake regulation protein n=1 Tax=Sinorhizobium fredii (strain USDA 257) TaxID=1185652 RepID=I3XA21_SINF2|nr:Fur family transcriptional regulator [Sinorhizobium fredii]AFL52727.1 zinc uptake transcriptional regulator protein, Fur family [Sinorhizobium fredii USDA 257]
MGTPQLTKNQSLVMGALAHSDGPLSAYTILDKLRDQGFRAPLQVYRALDKLLEYGLVHRLESLNAFVACSCPHDHEHDHGVTAFTICEDCGQVTEFHDEAIEQRLSTLVRAQSFKTEKTTIEIRGHCKSCA